MGPRSGYGAGQVDEGIQNTREKLCAWGLGAELQEMWNVTYILFPPQFTKIIIQNFNQNIFFHLT